MSPLYTSIYDSTIVISMDSAPTALHAQRDVWMESALITCSPSELYYSMSMPVVHLFGCAYGLSSDSIILHCMCNAVNADSIHPTIGMLSNAVSAGYMLLQGLV